MSKGNKNNTLNKPKKDKAQEKNPSLKSALKNRDYLLSMSNTPVIGESAHWGQLLPALFFSAVVVMIVRMVTYDRPLRQFYFWSGNGHNMNDFFSYGKMVAILICTVVALVFLLYRIFVQAFYIKRSFAYIPMIVYAGFVLLSYLFSDYKVFALWGWVDRFEGTLVLLCYMVMLFYIINTVNSEKNVKLVVYTLAVTSTLLSLLGLSQALGHDFFQTTIGKKMITPGWFWNQIDKLNFTFKNGEIYQTIYNINYVSFYLTLLIPLFGILFIRSFLAGKEEPLYKKVFWAALFALLIYNLIGSASSGGFFGMAVVVLVAVVVLNKRILSWWKPVVVLLAITLIIGGISYQRWIPELSSTIINATESESVKQAEASNVKHRLDYLETSGNDIKLGYQGEEVVFITYPDDPSSIKVTDANGKGFVLTPVGDQYGTFKFEDKRYDWITVKPATDEHGKHYLVITTDKYDWNFRLTGSGPKYFTANRNLVALHKVPAIGWENNPTFGSGRGYIWSRTLPMMQSTVLLGHGADTFCIYFPQEDYVGKYNSGSFSSKLNVIVDKPHSLYMGYAVGTGGISVIALLVLWLSYIIQSIGLFRRKFGSDFLTFSALGIFLGICGFLASALVDDSSVSVMPMFYGLLGTGIAANMLLKNTTKSNE